MDLTSSSADSLPPVRFEIVPPVATRRTRGAAERVGSATPLAAGPCDTGAGGSGVVEGVVVCGGLAAAHESADTHTNTPMTQESRDRIAAQCNKVTRFEPWNPVEPFQFP